MSAGAHARLDEHLLDRARALMAGGRAVLGICGAPGAGKSTLAARLAEAVGPAAVVVPMDGFHLHDDELARLGLSDRKGAPETFDVAGYVALLRRLHIETDHVVYAPEFDRSREESIAGAIAVRPEHRLVVTEGNYLLASTETWPAVRGAIDEVWYCEADDDVRRQRLVARHVQFGKPEPDARRWVENVDEVNARLIAATRASADLVIDMTLVEPD